MADITVRCGERETFLATAHHLFPLPAAILCQALFRGHRARAMGLSPRRLRLLVRLVVHLQGTFRATTRRRAAAVVPIQVGTAASGNVNEERRGGRGAGGKYRAAMVKRSYALRGQSTSMLLEVSARSHVWPSLVEMGGGGEEGRGEGGDRGEAVPPSVTNLPIPLSPPSCSRRS